MPAAATTTLLARAYGGGGGNKQSALVAAVLGFVSVSAAHAATADVATAQASPGPYVVAFTTRFLPIAVTACAAAIRSLNPELEEAVRILGGGRLTALAKVVMPLLKNLLSLNCSYSQSQSLHIIASLAAIRIQ